LDGYFWSMEMSHSEHVSYLISKCLRYTHREIEELFEELKINMYKIQIMK